MKLLTIFIAYPFAALGVAALLLVIAFARRSIFSGVVATLWAAYSYYEYLMQTRVLCTGECNIRIDLLLIYPVLLVLTLAGLVKALRRKSR